MEQTPLGAVRLSGLEYRKLEALKIVEKAGQHGRCQLELGMEDSFGEQDVLQLENREIIVRAGEQIIFAGVIGSSQLIQQAGEKRLQVILYTKSFLLDIHKKSRTFQPEDKTLQDMARSVASSYKAEVIVLENETISRLVYQEEQTDWEFLCRLAESTGRYIFADAKSQGIRISLGYMPFRQSQLQADDHILSQRVLLEKCLRAQENTAKRALPCEYTLTDMDTPDLSLGVGYGLKNGERDQIIMHSCIEAQDGLLINHLQLVNKEGCRVDARTELRDRNRGRYLTGTILAVDGTNVKVHFDVDESQDESEACWIPYENIVNNYMYSMPDVGDKVFVYHEENGKKMAQGSHRTSTDGDSDYDTPENRSLTSTNNLLQFQPDSVIMQAGRQGINSSIITMSDASGISIHSTQDIVFEAKQDIEVQAAQSETPEQFAKPEADYRNGMAAYTSHGGGYIGVNMGSNEKIGADVPSLKSASAPLEPVVVSSQAKACDAATGTTHAPAVPQATDSVSVSGFLQIEGKDGLTLAVGNSSIDISKDGNIQIASPVIEESGYNKGGGGSINNAQIEENEDNSLEVAKELAWDAAEMLPVVGNLMSAYDALQDIKEGNWGMAALDAFCAIPGVGNVAKGAKLGAKGLKAAAKLEKAEKAAKAVKESKVAVDAAKVEKKINDIIRPVEHVTSGAVKNAAKVDKCAGKGASVVLKQDMKKTVGNVNPKALEARTVEGRESRELPEKIRNNGGKDGVNNNRPKGDNKVEDVEGGDPVDLVTGSFILNTTDLVFKDLGDDFVLTRCYESLYENQGQHLGRRWLINVGMCLSRENSRITVLMPDLHLEKFQLQEDGTWLNQRGGSEAIKLLADKAGYKLMLPAEQKCYIFDLEGKLISIQQNNQQPVKITYQGKFIQHITLSCGQAIRFTYDDDKIRTITDPIGRVLRYTYDGDLLTQVTYPNGGSFQYNYDESGLILSVRDLNGKTYVKNTYDRDSRVTRQEMINGGEYVYFYDTQNRLTTYTEVHTGQRLTVHYNRKKLVEAIDYPDGTAEERSYDEWENQVYKKDRLGRETHWKYNAQGQLLQEKTPDGLITTHTYDEQGQRIQTQDNLGGEICYTYTREGWLQEKKTKQSEGKWQVEIYEYDYQGRNLRKTVNGQETRYWYKDNSPVPCAMRTPCGDEFRYEYDDAYRLSVIASEFGERSFGYDSLDHIVSDTDALDNTYTAEFDLMGNLRRECSPKEKAGDEPHYWRYAYDGMDNPVHTESPLGVIYAKEYDGESRLTKEIHPEAENGEGIAYDYDADGHKIRIHYPDGGIKRLFYDAEGNLIKEVRPNQYDKATDDGAGITYTYDAGNRCTSITDAVGNLVESSRYDAKGRCIYHQDAGQLEASREGMVYATTYRYDLAGNKLEERKAVSEKDGAMQYSLRRWTYDIHNNITEEKTWLTLQSENSASGLTRTICNNYDKQNRLIRVTDNLGAEVKYTYNSIGKRTGEERKVNAEETQLIKYLYDETGRMTDRAEKLNQKRKGTWWAHTRYAYDANSNIIEIKFPNGSKIQRDYDAVDRLIAETVIDHASGQKNTTNFAYDKAGNIIHIKDDCGRNEQFVYNLMNQRTQEITSEGRTQNLVYDKEGNITERRFPQEMSYCYQYDSAGRLTAVIGTDGKILETVSYDRAGRRIKVETAGGSGAEYAYTAAGWQNRIETKGGASQSYHYDAQGNVTGIVDGNGNETSYILDSWGRITEIRKADGSKENYAYDFAGNITEAVDGNGNIRKYAYDDNNQLKSITYPDGSQEHYLYGVDGNLSKYQDRNGIVNEYAWNVYGSMTERKAGDLRNVYEYAPNGQLTAAISSGMDYRYSYDKDGLLTAKKASGRTLLAYTYDELGRKTSQTDITGRKVNYKFDQSNNLAGILDEYDQSIVRFDRDADGAVKKITHANGMWQDIAYDADKNITSLTVATPGKILAQNTYRYDGNGQRIEKNELAGKTLYTYDSLNRLQQAEYPTYTERFSYDQAGNRLTRTAKDIEEQYVYDVNNWLTRRTVNGQAENYQYDQSGNLLQDANNTYEYDDFRRTSKVTTNTGNKISDEQREMLEKYLRERDISKPVDNDMYSRINEEFGKTGKKEQLRKDWAQHYNLDEWPKYRDEMIGREGRLGWNYDLHHIIPRRYGGPNAWWNMIPAANPEAHQRGIHRSGGMFRKLFPKLKRR